MLSLVISSIISSDKSWSLSDSWSEILPYSKENSPGVIDFPFTERILLLDRTLPSPKNPPKVATNPKIIIPTIIEEPEAGWLGELVAEPSSIFDSF